MRCIDASDTALIENNGVAPDWGLQPILEWLPLFSIRAVLPVSPQRFSLTLSVKGPLKWSSTISLNTLSLKTEKRLKMWPSKQKQVTRYLSWAIQEKVPANRLRGNFESCLKFQKLVETINFVGWYEFSLHWFDSVITFMTLLCERSFSGN